MCDMQITRTHFKYEEKENKDFIGILNLYYNALKGKIKKKKEKKDFIKILYHYCDASKY